MVICNDIFAYIFGMFHFVLFTIICVCFIGLVYVLFKCSICFVLLYLIFSISMLFCFKGVCSVIITAIILSCVWITFERQKKNPHIWISFAENKFLYFKYL